MSWFKKAASAPVETLEQHDYAVMKGMRLAREGRYLTLRAANPLALMWIEGNVFAELGPGLPEPGQDDLGSYLRWEIR